MPFEYARQTRAPVDHERAQVRLVGLLTIAGDGVQHRADCACDPAVDGRNIAVCRERSIFSSGCYLDEVPARCVHILGSPAVSRHVNTVSQRRDVTVISHSEYQEHTLAVHDHEPGLATASKGPSVIRRCAA